MTSTIIGDDETGDDALLAIAGGYLPPLVVRAFGAHLMSASIKAFRFSL